MTDLPRTLEQRCRELVHASTGDASRFAPSALIRRELSLTLDHLDQWRGLMSTLIREASGRVASLEDRLMNLEPRIYELAEWRGERLRRRSEAMQMVARVDEQRRQLLLTYEKSVQTLRDRLLQLWNKHHQLYIENGDRQDFEET